MKPCPQCGIPMRKFYIQIQTQNKPRINSLKPMGYACIYCRLAFWDADK